MKKILITLSFVIAYSSLFYAQDMSRRQHLKIAKKMLKAENYLDAAIHFEKASNEKHSDDLLFEAGTNFSLARDYGAANRCFSKIDKSNQKDFEDLFLLKGRVLKSLGQYEDAIQSFSSYIKNYKGKDKIVKDNIVQIEIKGCELALDQSGSESYSIEILSENINSPEEHEFAPFQIGDNLYFSSTVGDFINIYRSELEEGNWLFSVIPRNFNKLKGQNFCNGSFSPDMLKFYFNICETNSRTQNSCSIYMMENEGGSWSDPKKLPETINTAGTTNNQPSSTYKNGKEYLYFSSNRANGQGGMDLWYVSKPINSDISSFSAPRNLGPNINSVGDEITPFYIKGSGVLYFSSNGRVSLGGFDIFNSIGMAYKWAPAQNVGTPLNSSADDIYYFLNDDGEYGYVTSNRKVQGKNSNMDDDILSFYPSSVNYSFSGNVYDKSSNQILDDISVTVYEENGGNKNLLTAQDFPNGNFNLGLLPNKQLILSISKPGYASDEIRISTFASDALHQDESIFLELENINYGESTASTSSFPIESTPITETAEVETVNTTIVSTPSESIPVNEATYTPTTTVVTEVNVISSPVVSTESTAVTTNAMPARITSYEPSISSRAVISNDVTTTTDGMPARITSYEPSISSRAAISNDVTTTTDGMPSRITSYDPSLANGPNTHKVSPNEEGLPTRIKSYEPALQNKQVVQSSTPEYVNETTQFEYDGAIYTSRAKAKYEPGAFSTDSKKFSGSYFKVQLLAIKDFDATSSRYNSIIQLGTLDSEYLYEKGLTRVLLSHFITFKDAMDVRNYARKNGFKGAFVVKYEDGQRLGQHFSRN